LDGYDEISFSGGSRNFVREELNSILSILRPGSQNERDLERLASNVLIPSHFADSKKVGTSPFMSRAAHDQYATIPEKCHVIHNMIFSQNK
jgi:hypothetical protein